jgi:hypothetical protein
MIEHIHNLKGHISCGQLDVFELLDGVFTGQNGLVLFFGLLGCELSNWLKRHIPADMREQCG